MAGSIRPLPVDYRWPSGLPWYIGALAAPRLEVLAERLGLPVERFDADGLGPTIASAAMLPSGLAVVLTEHEHLVELRRQTGPTIEVDASEVAQRGTRALLEETLAAFGLDRSHVGHEPASAGASEAEDAVARLRAAMQKPPQSPAGA